MGSSLGRIFDEHQKTPVTSHKSKQDPTAVAATKRGQQTNEGRELVHYRRAREISVTEQLYKTKLLTLFLLRFMRNEVKFYLGANNSGFGALDDLCFKYKPTNSDKYVIVFLQAILKLNTDKNKLTMSELLSIDGDFSIQKHFDSYLMIRQRFAPKREDVIFNSNYEESQCYFVVYTPLNHELKCTKPLEQNDSNDNVKNIIQTYATGDILQLEYEHFEFLKRQFVETNIRQLGKRLITHIMESNESHIMDDYYIKMYHVVLAQCVVEESETAAEGVRYKFRREFFDGRERLLTVFREAVFDEVVNKKSFQSHEEDINTLISKFLNENMSANNNKIIHYQNNDLFTNQFILSEDKIIDAKNFDLQKCIKLNPSVVRNNKKIQTQKFLESLEFTLPAKFGNRDICLNGNADKMVKRLDFMTINLQKLLKTAKFFNDTNIVNVDEGMVGPGKLVERIMVEHNGGLGSALGNLLVVDTDTGTLKFNVCSPLPEHANMLWNKLKLNHDENLLTTYRFKFCVDGFPKTSFEDDLYEEYLVKDFFDHYWLCTGQAKEDEVKYIAKKYMNTLLSRKGEIPELSFKSDTIFLLLHDKVQEWCKISGAAQYLTEHTTCPYVTEIVDKPFLSIINEAYVNHLRSLTIEFDKNAMKFLSLDKETVGVKLIKTDSVTLTALKLMQNYKYSAQYSFIDFDYLFLADEVRNSNVENFIVTCKPTMNETNKTICISLAKFVHDVPNKNITVIIAAELFNTLKQELTCAYFELRDDNTSLFDLSPNSRSEFLNKCYVVWQGQNVPLKSITSHGLYKITSHILEMLINKDVIEIGDPLTTPSYNKIQPFYIERYLTRDRCPVKKYDYLSDDEKYTDVEKNLVERVKLRTLLDLKQRIIVITTPPGMGQSTFMTHLSIETVKKYPYIFIAHINLMDFTSEFDSWRQSNTRMHEHITVRDVYRTIIRSRNFARFRKSSSYSDRWRTEHDMRMIELDLFWDKCHNGEVLFIFKGFDETCSLFEREVIHFIRVTATFARERKESRNESKVWITSCSCNNPKHVLEREFGQPYRLEPFSEADQKIYFEKYWKHHMRLNEFTHEQISNVTAFMKYMSKFSDTVGTIGLKMDANGSSFSQNMPVQSLKHINIPVYSAFVMAADYFRNEIIKITPSPATKILLESCDDQLISLSQLQVARLQHSSDEVLKIGSPLYVHLIAEYLQTEIQNNQLLKDSNNWDLDSYTFSLYKRFLENKMNIYFEYGNHNKTQYYKHKHEMEFRSRELDMHRILGCYHLFGNDVERIMSTDDLSRMKIFIEYGDTQKVIFFPVFVDGVPIFVYRTLAEFFAADYICEALKSAYASQQLDRIENIWDFIVSTVIMRDSESVSSFLDYQLFNDVVLKSSVNEEQTKRMVFESLMKQARNMKPGGRTTIDCAIGGKLKATAMYLVHCFEGYLQSSDLKYFINLVKNNDLLWIALRNGHEDFVEIVINIFRSFDESSFCDMIKQTQCIFSTLIKSPTNNKKDTNTSKPDCVKWSVSKTFAFSPSRQTYN